MKLLNTARKLKEEYEKWGLAINLEKTKYVCMGAGKETLTLGRLTSSILDAPCRARNANV